MKRMPWVFPALPVFAPSWAALHDILKGEPDPRLEVAATAVCIPLLVCLAMKSVHTHRKEAVR